MKKLVFLGLGVSVILATLSFLVPAVKDNTLQDIIDYDELGRC
ncbi:hypothetical protein QI155_10415 [Thermodesulfovibrio sp. 1176]|nr:hypothetical protein [Thermodesulfovibrio sp. 1176]MDI1472944.1 hypothetical protein [Thermodesulfovibrio sp. 1176]